MVICAASVFASIFFFYKSQEINKKKEIFFLVLFLFFFSVLSDEVKSKQKERIKGKEEVRDAAEGRRTRKPFIYW